MITRQDARSTSPGLLGVILAGGKSSRMGGIDKGGVTLAGRPMIHRVIDRFAPQVARLVVNAPDDRYPDVDLPRAPDTLAGQPGPLTGVLAGMRWAEVHAPEVEFVATTPVDTPFLPQDIVARLHAAISKSVDIAYAVSPAGPQPVFVVARIGLARSLERDLTAGDASRVGDWIRRQNHIAVPFPDDDAFANINSPEDMASAEARLRMA